MTTDLLNRQLTLSLMVLLFMLIPTISCIGIYLIGKRFKWLIVIKGLLLMFLLYGIFAAPFIWRYSF